MLAVGPLHLENAMATQLSTYSIGAGEIKRLRAPRGYRVRQWADGFFHVYYGEECILETLSRHAAYSAAYLHRAAQPCMNPTGATNR